MCSEVPCRCANLLDFRSLIHGVENSLRSRLDTKPDFRSTSGGQRCADTRCHEVHTGLHHKRRHGIAGNHFFGKLLDPSRREPKNVVGEPNAVRGHLVGKSEEFLCDIGRTTLSISRAEERFRAPVAMVRTSAGGDDAP